MAEPLRIIFMGTPEFAVESLKALVTAGCNVVAVVTVPDKPSGRGLKLNPSPVKVYAESVGLPVLQPEKLRNKEFLEVLRSYNADVQVVVAFRMLPEVVWAMPRLGTFNLHGSLLPDYRGAAPINWAIMNGDTETGVTTFFIEKEIDTGNIIFQDREPIHAEDTVGDVYVRLMERGAQLVVKTIHALEEGNVVAVPQPVVEQEKIAPKLFKETCEINWNQSGESIRNFVRGLSPYPAAWTTLNALSCKVYKVAVVAEEGEPAAIGTWRSDGKKYLHFRASDSWVALEELQLEGKKRMKVDELLRGYRING